MIENLSRQRADAVLRNDVAGESRADDESVFDARSRRIVHRYALGEERGEVAVPHRVAWHCLRAWFRELVIKPFDGAEKERAIPPAVFRQHDRATNGAAEPVVSERRLFAAALVHEEVRGGQL